MAERINLAPEFDQAELLLQARALLRPELYKLLHLSEKTIRFNGIGIPKEYLTNTVLSHTLSLFVIVDQLPLDPADKKQCKLGALLHDLPETFLLRMKRDYTELVYDITAVRKIEEPQTGLKVEITERQIAERILKPEELQLYVAFERAKAFLNGVTSEIPDQTGLILRVADAAEGDVTFHRLAKAASHQARFGEVPQKLAFDRFRKYSERLGLLKDTPVANTALICQRILDSGMQTIADIWSEVPDSEVPPIVLQNISVFTV